MGNGTGVNLTRLSSPSLNGGGTPLPGRGEDAKTQAHKFKPVTEHTVVKREIPVTDPSPVEESVDPAAPAVEAAEQDRHARWREAQAKKAIDRAAAKDQAEAKRQARAAELLRKGDLSGAAAAVGLPVSEFVALTNQAALGMKPDPEKPKELTPQEKFDADRAAFSKEMADFRAEQTAERNHRAMTGFIAENIRPVLADKNAYELIHAKGAGDIETYAYRYMNQHYADTSEKDASGNITKPGEILSAKDVLDAIEAELVRAQTASLEASRPLKKLAKFFAPIAESAVEEAAVGIASELATSTALTASRRTRIAEAMAAEQSAVEEPPAESAELGADPASIEAATTARAARLPGGANVRAVRNIGLTAAQKIARVRAEEEAASTAARTLAARRK